MIYSPKAIRWVDCLEFLAILGFALLLPASLPAGGADRLPLELRRRQSGRDPLVVPFAALLRSAPRHEAPPLQRLTSVSLCGCCAVGRALQDVDGFRFQWPLLGWATFNVVG